MTHAAKKSAALAFLLFIGISLSAAEITLSPGVGATVHTVRSFFEVENIGESDEFSQKAVTYIIPVP